MENVSEIPMSRQRAEKILREAARDSRRLVNTVQYSEKEAWYEMTSFRQIVLCLEAGRVIKAPSKDEHGNWVCVSHRLCSGIDVYVTTAIGTDDGEHSANVYILNVQNRIDP